MLSPCHPFRLDLGQVTESSVRGFVDRILQHPDYQRLGQREHEGCGTCPEQTICGNCQAAVVGKGGPIFSNDHFCDTVIGPLAERHLTTAVPMMALAKRKLVRLPLLQSSIHTNQH
jgi:radical SAM protein with 4Fe4S-binding SPASM domain